MPVPQRLSDYAEMIETELQQTIAAMTEPPELLNEAMAYNVCGGGKRIRGALALGACAAVGGREEEALPAACALEMVHAFSLIHDDLPCMDDSDLRRGKPTAHKVYGEAMAVLAGDALLVKGIEVLLSCRIVPKRGLAAAGILLNALGPAGMIGGQVLDMAAERTRPDINDLRRLDAAKTGALIRAAARIGAIIGGAGAGEEEALDQYAASLGLAFQIIDDLLDITGDAAVLGKPAGGDVVREKATYPALLGAEGARELARREIEQAVSCLAPFGERAGFLVELARYVEDRDR